VHNPATRISLPPIYDRHRACSRHTLDRRPLRDESQISPGRTLRIDAPWRDTTKNDRSAKTRRLTTGEYPRIRQKKTFHSPKQRVQVSSRNGNSTREESRSRNNQFKGHRPAVPALREFPSSREKSYEKISLLDLIPGPKWKKYAAILKTPKQLEQMGPVHEFIEPLVDRMISLFWWTKKIKNYYRISFWSYIHC